MKRTFILLTLMFVVLYCNSQQILIKQFEKTYGGSGGERLYGMEQTSDGGYILVGNTSSFGAGLSDIYLVKTDANGNQVWSKTFGGTGSDDGYSVQQTTDGGYIIAGQTNSFGAGGLDVYLIKTDVSGDTLWTKTFGGTYTDVGQSVKQTSDGGYIVTGMTYSLGAYANDVYIIKTDANGDLQWQKVTGILVYESGDCIQLSNGGYIITGITYGGGNAFLLKTDALGNTLWVNYNYISNAYGYGKSVVPTPDGGYAFIGSMCGTRWNDCNILLTKTDSIGNIIWQKTYGGIMNDFGSSLKILPDGGFLLGGETSNYGAGGSDIIFIRTDSNGNEIRRGTAGGTNDEGAGNNIYGKLSVILSNDGGYVLSGLTTSYGSGGADFYLVKLLEFSDLIPTISGRIYNDVDSNCVYNDSIDFPVSNRMVQATDGPYFVYTDNNGNYNLRVPDGSYNIAQTTLANDIFTGVSCPTTPQLYNVSVTGSNTVSGKDFFNVLANPQCDVAVNLQASYPVPMASPCINQTYTVCATFTNNGSAVTNAIFHLDISPVIGLTLSNVSATSDCNCTPTISGQTVTCSPGSAFPANKSCTICVDVFVPNFITLGQSLAINASITGTCGGDLLPPTNAIPLAQVVECAIDPNDKLLISPVGCGPFGNISGDEPLIYQIRFQNTGNAPAHNIVLKDILNSNLDISTFKIISSSHPITRVELFPSNTLMISYIGIELPDSGSNQSRSHGFVSFSIKPFNNLPDGTILTNEAGIYFDLNEPVITNTTLNTIRDVLQPVTLPDYNNVCLNDSIFTLYGGYPTGGTYSGDGIINGKFNPTIAGVGTHLITYSYAAEITESNYTLNQMGLYAPVQGTGTRVYLGDDQVSSAIPVGFNFNFYGLDYSNIYISSNGFITFNADFNSACCSGLFLPHHQASPSNLIAFAWTDLYPPGNGFIDYFTTGTAPERKFIVNINNIPSCCNSVPKVSTQIILYESTNIIELHSSSIEITGTMGIVNNGGTLATPVPGRNSSSFSITNDFIQFIPPIPLSLCSNEAKSSITVNPSPTVSIIPNGSTTFCDGENVTLNTNFTGTSFATYLWSNGSTLPSITVSSSGIYTVTINDICGSAVSVPVSVTVNPKPSAIVNVSGSTNLCPGDNVILTADIADSYLWSDGSTSQSITVNTTGIYTVTVTTNGCSAVSEPVNITVNDSPCGKDKILICHITPGNHGNPQTICISINALQSHLAHGDYCGVCTTPKSALSDSDNSDVNQAYAPIYSEDNENDFVIVPNPFNESTTINFKTPQEGIVSLEIYNSLGQKIADLFNDRVDKEKQTKVEFFTNNLNSGIYYAKLRTNNKVLIKQMVITK